MRKLLLILFVAVMCTSSTCSKEDEPSGSTSTSITSSQVPSAVMTAFNSRYPSATGQIEWDREDGNTYKVKFFIGTQRWQAIFSSTGAFMSEKAI